MEKKLFGTEPFVRWSHPRVSGAGGEDGDEDALGKTVDLGTRCPVEEDLGFCPFGWRCRFLGGHLRKNGEGSGSGGVVGSGAGSVIGSVVENLVGSVVGSAVGGVIGREANSGGGDRIGQWELLRGSCTDTDKSKRREMNWSNLSTLQALKSQSVGFFPISDYLTHLFVSPVCSQTFSDTSDKSG